MKKSNVMIIITVPLDFNGINIATLELIGKADKDKFDFTLVSCKKTAKEVEKAYLNAGCKVIKLEYRDEHHLKYLKDLRAAIRENHVDVVHAMGNSATLAIEMLAAKKEGVPLRISHSRNTTCNHKIIDKLLRPLLYKNCNRRLACGDAAGKWLFGKRDFVVFKNGKEYEKYAFSSELRDNFRREWGADNGTLLIGHVGIFNKQKNHAFIVEIAKRLKESTDDFKTVLIGEGALKQEVYEAVKAEGLEDKFVFTGNMPNVNQAYSAFDVMILPSLHEGLPNVAVEWQINGLPCLISDKVTKECVINGNVEFLPIDDAKIWADRLAAGEYSRLTDQAEIRKNLIDCGFDLNENVKTLQKIYSEKLG